MPSIASTPLPPRRASGHTLRFWLGWLVVACVVPAWAATALSIARAYQREDAALRTSTIGTARALVQAIDTELQSAQTTLLALATSPQFASGDLAPFYQQAQAIVRTLPIMGIVVLAPTGQQLMNTLVPWGAPLPRQGAPDILMNVFTTGRPVVSNLFMGPVAHKPIVAVNIPVTVDGQVAFGMGMTIAPERLGEILLRQQLPADWIAAITDSKGTIVARTQAPDQYIGRKIAPALQQQIEAAREGVLEAETLDGIRVLTGYSRSMVSGWSVAIEIPRAGAEAELRRSLWLTVGTASALLLIALAFARFISRRIAGSIDALRAPALALGAQQPIALASGTIAEVNEIGTALATAAELLRQRSIERERALLAEHRMMADKAAAEQASRAKSEFLAMMSHEIRTPMNGIVGYADLLAEAPIKARYRRYAEVISSSAAALLTIIDGILDFSRIDAGRLDIELVPVELSRIIDDALLLVGIAAERKQLRLAVRPGARPTWVKADPDRLRQVLINLLGNAVKFTEHGAVEVALETAADGRIRVSVIDQGIGIPPEALGRLFQSFEQADSTIGRRFGGTGLGLAISKRLVALMGGDIGVQSEPGRGSIFTVTLESAPAPDPLPDASPLAAAGAALPARILVADDIQINRRLVDAFLRSGGHRLDYAVSGREAVDRAAADCYDLILMDVNMPDMDGLEAARQIRASGGPNAATPILALTASATAEEVGRCMAAGMSGHLAKPISRASLSRAVAAHARAGAATDG